MKMKRTENQNKKRMKRKRMISCSKRRRLI